MKRRIAAWRRAFETEENAVLPTLSAFAWNYAAFTMVARIPHRRPEDSTPSHSRARGPTGRL